MTKLSIIIPVLNEESVIESLIQQANGYLLADTDLELIFVDGGSEDETLSKLNGQFSQNSRVTILNTEKGRAAQMNVGARYARGAYLLFLHADTRLPLGFSNEIQKAIDEERQWGRFDVCLDDYHPAFRMISFFINYRSRLTHIATGDQALFFSRKVFDWVGGFPDQLLMEDVEICKRLKRQYRPFCSHLKVLTSSRKWKKEGILKTILLMWSLRFRYYRGDDPEKLHARYYR